MGIATIKVRGCVKGHLYDCKDFELLVSVDPDGSRFYFLYGYCVSSCGNRRVVERVVLDGSRDEDLMVQRLLELRAELAKKASEGVSV